LPKTRKEALEIGSSYFYTGRPCKHGHVAPRYSSGGACALCQRLRVAAQYGRELNDHSPRIQASIARTKAAKNGEIYYVPAKPCKHGHKFRWVASNNCVGCDAIAQKKNPEKRRFARIKKEYGLSQEDYENMLASQNMSCAVCGGQIGNDQSTHIDHCHDTGVVRGLLCQKCNQAIGLLQDSPEIMLKAAEYVKNARA
jgi:hypothetical protein